jgi:hypothetical protein
MACKKCDDLVKKGKPCPECEKKVLIGQTMKFCMDIEKEDKDGTKQKLGTTCDALFKKVTKGKMQVGAFIKKVDKAIPRIEGEERVFDAIIDIAKEKRLIK